MKKLALTLFLVCTLGLSATSLTLQTNCTDYAMQSATAEFSNYEDPYTDIEFLTAAMWYYDFCQQVEGNIADPIFL